MPIVPIVIALVVLIGLLVAALGPALRIAQRRALDGEGEDALYVPLEWERTSGVATARRFAPSPRGTPRGRVAPGRRAA